MMIVRIVLVIGMLAAASVMPSPVHSQDFLKQLENKLREAAGQKTDSTSEAAKQDTEETPPVGNPAEDLPLPSLDRPNENAPMQLPEPPARSGPIVITPRKKTPTPPVPQGDFAADASSQDAGGYLGLTVEPLSGGAFGLAVVEVTPQSPAWKSGFRGGDRVIGVGGQAVTTIDQFATELQKYGPGMPVKFLVQRRGRSVNLTAVLQERGVAQQIQGIPPGELRNEGAPLPYQPLSGALAEEGGMVLGVSVSDLSDAFRRQFGIPVYQGAAVSEVVVGSAAERAGLRPGDCIVDIDGRAVNFADEVVEATRSAVVGRPLLVGYYRGRQKKRVEVTLLPVADPGAYQPSAGVLPPEQMTPEYVAQLHDEIARLNDELETMRRRVQDLESRLQRKLR